MIDTSLLNVEQRKAVLDNSKYLRIVAGAGSGKTRVLTMRIAHLIQDEGVFPSRILAITFTNKAANEMKDRIRTMLGNEAGQPWISTIHSLCVRILRQDIQTMGYPRNFTVADSDDQRSILREGYRKYELDAKSIPIASVINYISTCKCTGIDPQTAAKGSDGFHDSQMKAKLYAFYEDRLHQMYALDFDDLILVTVKMFSSYPEVLKRWQKHFSYIHVDEFQDIDRNQYRLIRQLAGKDNSLYVVGDPDQTIYTWRGADVNIILNFKSDFPDAETIFLNQNYRSTSNILNAANCVIRNNKERLKKDLFSSGKPGAKVIHYSSAGADYEAEWIAEKILELHSHGLAYHEIAVLYRSNYLSRSLEQALIDNRIPYVIYGGLRFYERQEVKDALCYLRMAVTADDLALKRIINLPKRGVGKKTLDALLDKAQQEHRTMYEVLRDEMPFTGKTGAALKEFVQMVERWRASAADPSVQKYRLFQQILDESGLRKSLEDENETERVENLKELIDDIRQYFADNPQAGLDEYLQEVSLYGDRDETLETDHIQMMTVHAAKGLEFDTVFVSDMNDGIFPSQRSMEEGKKGIEEERRLAYVAFTRAKRQLFITDATGYSFILQRTRTPSRFIDEIENQYIEHLGAQRELEDDSSARLHGSFEETSSSKPVLKNVQESGGRSFRKGERVVHSKFGEGIVIRCQNNLVEIAFSYPYGIKKIASSFPGLKRMSELKN